MMQFIGGLILFGLAVWAIVNILNSSAETGTKTLWILLVLLLPVIGFVAWFFAGPRAGKA